MFIYSRKDADKIETIKLNYTQVPTHVLYWCRYNFGDIFNRCKRPFINNRDHN